MLKRIMIAVIAVSGCAADEPDTIYLDVDMAPGRLDQARADSAWATGYSAYGEDGNTLPPGLFSIRVKHETGPEDPLFALEGASVTVHPISHCQAKTKLTCDATGACFGEAIQSTLGICILQINALADGGREARGCWFLGVYPRWEQATPEEEDLVHALDCGGTSTRISANPPS